MTLAKLLMKTLCQEFIQNYGISFCIEKYILSNNFNIVLLKYNYIPRINTARTYLKNTSIKYIESML